MWAGFYCRKPWRYLYPRSERSCDVCMMCWKEFVVHMIKTCYLLKHFAVFVFFQFRSVRVRVVPAGNSYSKTPMCSHRQWGIIGTNGSSLEPAGPANRWGKMHGRLCHQDFKRPLRLAFRALFTCVSHPKQVWVRLQKRKQRALLGFGL